MRQLLRLLAELVGAALVVAGLGLAWLPLGVIAAGVFLVVAASPDAAAALLGARRDES